MMRLATSLGCSQAFYLSFIFSSLALIPTGECFGGKPVGILQSSRPHQSQEEVPHHHTITKMGVTVIKGDMYLRHDRDACQNVSQKRMPRALVNTLIFSDEQQWQTTAGFFRRREAPLDESKYHYKQYKRIKNFSEGKRQILHDKANALVTDTFPSFFELHALEVVPPKRFLSVFSRVSGESSVNVLQKEECQEKNVSNGSTARLVESFVENFIKKRALHARDLTVTSDRAKMALFRFLQGDWIRPYLEIGSVRATFDRLAFFNFKLSGGGALTASGIRLSASSFMLYAKRRPQFNAPFQLYAENCTFTQEDLRTSTSMSNGLQVLLRRILKRLLREAPLDVVRVMKDAVELSVKHVDIEASNKLSCRGSIETRVGVDTPYAVRTGLAISGGGHVLEFPGMEMIVNPGPLQIVFPLHRLHPISLCVGQDACFERIVIDGRRKQLKLSVRATITPSTLSKKKPTYFSDEILAAKPRARYSCDLGGWLTNLCRL